MDSSGIEESKDIKVFAGDSELIRSHLNNYEILQIDASTDFEFSTRDYFTEILNLGKSRINVIEPVNASSSVIVGSQDGSVYEISQPNISGNQKKTVARLIAKGSKPVLSLAASPNGQYLAISQFSVVSILNLVTGKLEAEFHRVKGRILAMEWDPFSQLLLMGRANGDIFSWNLGEDISSAMDTTRELEIYETLPSPVVSIAFHPSGRAFFVALQGGGVFLVRLVRTERELGIRSRKRSTKPAKGTYVVNIGTVPALINEMVLDPRDGELMVSSADGLIYRWRLRGLRSKFSYPVGSDSAGFISKIHIDKNTNLQVTDNSTSAFDDNNYSLFTTLGRNLRLRFWCTEEEVYEEVTPTIHVVNESVSAEEGPEESSDSENSSGSTKEVDDLLAQLEESSDKPARLEGPSGLVAETPRFLETVVAGQYDSESGILWVGSRSGRLTGFDVAGFLSSTSVKARINNICSEKL